MPDKKRVRCPIRLADAKWIDDRMAWLQRTFGRGRLLDTIVVLATADFFPDPYDRSEEDVHSLLERVCDYMRVDASSIHMHFFSDRNPVHDERGSNTAAGLYHADRDHYWVGIDVSLLDDPLALVATMAHELGHVLLLGYGHLSPEAEDHEPLTDLMTVFAGMGVITANSVIREHYWQAGTVAGWGMKRSGYLDMPMYGYALAVFARERGEQAPEWARELRGDVRSAFDRALAYFDNPDTEETEDTEGLEVEVPHDPSASDDDVAADEFSPDNAEEARCTFCKTRIPADEAERQRQSAIDPGALICSACSESIEANEEDLARQMEHDEQFGDLSTRYVRWIFVLFLGALGTGLIASCLGTR